MRLKELFDYSKYADVLHLNKFELAFCVGYFFLALGICLYSTPKGSIFDTDSLQYVLQAENFYLNHDFRIFSGAPMYPSLIALIMGLGLTSEQSASIIPIISYSLLGFPIFFLGKIISRPITGYVSCIVCLFCGKYLLLEATVAMTEMPYIFLTVVAILFIAIFNRYGHVSSINIAGIFTILATFTRYIGIVLIPIGIIVIVMNIRDLRKAMITALNFCLISIIPFGIWELVQKANVYVMTTTIPSRPFGITMDQFRHNLEIIFYNSYEIEAIIVLLFVIIALIAIYLNRHLIAFAKDTIPLSGYIIIYSMLMILLTSSYGDYSLTYGLHIRYMVPIFPFVVLFIFSSFSDRYNSNNVYNFAYIGIPIILCSLLVAQGANSLYSDANVIRENSINSYSDEVKLNKYILEYNITNNDIVYFDIEKSYYPRLRFVFQERTPYIKREFIMSTSSKTTIIDNLTSFSFNQGSSSVTSLPILVKKSKNHTIYLIAPIKVLQNFMQNSSKDISFINPVNFSESFICMVVLKKGICNSNPYYITDSNTSINVALAGSFIGQKQDQLLILKSYPTSTKENILQIMNFPECFPTKTEYPDRPGTAWLNANHLLLSGDFMGLGYDQAFHIDGDKIVIEDFSQGKAPAIIRYSEVLANDSALKNLADAKDAQFAGDFLGRGHSQVLFIDRNPKGGKLVIADFSKGKTAEMTEFSEIEGNSTLLCLLLDDKDKQFSGDFMGLGHDQLLMINCNHTGAKEPMIIIADFSKGNISASVKYLENWGETLGFGGWLDADDTQIVGDFMDLGHSQVLFVNHGHNGGKIMIDDFSKGKPPAKIRYWESWNQGTIFQGWLGTNDTRIVGDFKDLGYSQVLFLNNSINGSNATIVEFIDGKSMIAL